MQDTLDSWSNRKYINHAAILRPPKSERNLEECGEGGVATVSGTEMDLNS